MNFLAHAREVLDRPWEVAGTALPDWLRALDRRGRLRPRHLAGLDAPRDPRGADLLRGVRRHLRDNDRFHAGAAFREIRAGIARRIRAVEGGASVRAAFFAHVLLEVLLDAHLVEQDPTAPAAYDAALRALDLAALEDIVGGFSPRPPTGLAALVERFRAARIFEAYLDDRATAARLDWLGRRVGLPPLPPGLVEVVAGARPLVREGAAALLDGLPGDSGRNGIG